MKRILGTSLAAAVAAGCSRTPTRGDAVILAHIVLDPPLAASCIALDVRIPGGGILASRRLDRLADKHEYTVAVYQDAFPAEIALGARALFGAGGCTDPLAQNAISDEQLATFAVAEIRTVELYLKLPPAGIDVDRDGFSGFANGGPDCDDADPATNPAATEDCTVGGDRNCNGLAGCVDPGCNRKACATRSACCNGRCEQEVCDDGIDNDCNGRTDCGDPVCSGIPGPEVACGDGRDNDCDGNPDCLDPECDNKTCAPGKLCDPVVTTCSKDCVPNQTPETDCGDGRDNDCNGVGDCADSNCAGEPCAPNGKICQAGSCACPLGNPPELACTDSVDNDCDGQKDCGDADCNGVSCATELCTRPNTCGAGTCQRTPVSCTSPPGPCYQATGTCVTSDGGCDHAPLGDGTNCAGGKCFGANCVPFLYTPSNVNLGSIPPPSGLDVVINCSATYDTGDTGTNPFSPWCNAMPPTYVRAQLTGGGSDVQVLAMSSLTVTSGNTLTLTGARPAVLLVYGAVNVTGRIAARGTAATPGPGGGHAAACGGGTGIDGKAGADNGGGGGGAGHATNGAAGGQGGTGGAAGGGARGTTFGNTDLEPLRGGCNGGRGGVSSANPGGLGGGGGGAIQISAAGTVTLNGAVVTVSAGGGRGGILRDGGGGGGSGGAILLEAERLETQGTNYITGGGGGGGEGGCQTTGAGLNGTDAPSASTAAAANVGTGPCEGGGGGAGGAPGSNPSAGAGGAGANGGGGGGGGAMGRLRVNTRSGCQITGTVNVSVLASDNGGTNCPW